ncbi:hypothetical protein [Roseivirga sp.]|uniref:hypothetical protein n=1 Tax=Roseivirga sp. TaxID=1964215 RepID=UPI003B52DAE9
MKETSSINYSKVIKSLYIIGALFIITYIITLSINLSQESATKAGSIGDALGGLANPFIGILGVIATFLAFWVQFEANERQRNDIKQERFESKFYELLRLHKENVNEIEIPAAGLKGRPCFEFFLKEFYGLHSIVEIVNIREGNNDLSEKEDTIERAFDLFFYGITNQATSKYSNWKEQQYDGNTQLIFEKDSHQI